MFVSLQKGYYLLTLKETDLKFLKELLVGKNKLLKKVDLKNGICPSYAEFTVE